MASGVHEFHDPKSSSFIDPSRWCITREDLDFFEKEVKQLWKSGQIPDDPDPALCNPYHDDPKIGPNLYRVNECYIKPKTREAGGMSWALMRNPGGLECDVFATHAWVEGVFEFTRKVRRAWPRDAKHIYICFLANPQNSDISQLLSGSVLDSPFARALSLAKYMLVIPNNQKSIYSRLWCVLEAWIAVLATEARGLTIIVPRDVAPDAVAEYLTPGLIWFLLGFFVVSHLADTYANDFITYFGPSQWLVLAVLSSKTMRSFWRWFWPTFRLRVVTVATWSIRIAYFELFLSGSAGGMAWLLLNRYSYKRAHHHMLFEPGVGTTVFMLLVAIICLHAYNIYLVIVGTLLRLEDKRLAFSSVRDASCSCPGDADNIWAVVEERAEEVDAAIHVLRTIGRYDASVKFNLDRGMCVELARDGVNPFKLACAVLLWEFWWVTDLASDSHVTEWTRNDVLAYVIPCATLVVLFPLMYFVGDRCVFAIEVALWSGLNFLWISRTSYFFTEEHVLALTMSKSTLWLQVGCFAVMLLVDAYFYGGFLKAHRSAAADFCGAERCRSLGGCGYEGPDSDVEDVSEHDVEALTKPCISPAMKAAGRSVKTTYGSTMSRFSK
eukprot:TRINITY_DN3726_c0_g2_i1.p1 TRINITY_DN3726_c0_g2~~TRINITY_DN3726_c0_g2_i1.p1  ORF type:complete len:610 (-),score=45.74 TRINITY_DN3726_c0_g2_i1:86-1915(-)